MKIAKNQLEAVKNINLRNKNIIHTHLKSFNPKWLEPGWIAHPLDEGDRYLLSQGRAHESPGLLALCDEEGFDGKNGVVHMYWGPETMTTKHLVNPKLMDAIDSLEVDGKKAPEIIGELKAITDEEELSVKKASLLDMFLAKALYVANVLAKSSEKTLSSIKADQKAEYKYIFKLINHPGFNQDTGTVLSTYSGHGVETFWEGMNRRALDTLRYSSSNSTSIARNEKFNDFHLELDWIASKQYDAVCRLLGIDSNQIRACLPKILKSYGRPINGYCSKLLQAFKRLQEVESVKLENLEVQTGFLSSVEVKVGNKNTLDDAKHSKNTIREKVTETKRILKRSHELFLKDKSKSKKKNGSKIIVNEIVNLELFEQR